LDFAVFRRILLHYFASVFNGWCWVIFCGDSNGSANGRLPMANADAPPRVSVSMAEALDRLLSYCENNPHKVAA
jgi:hypothetical protein